MAVAIASIALAVFVTGLPTLLWTRSAWAREAPFMLLLAPTAIAAWYGGMLSGLLAVALGIATLQLSPHAPYPGGPASAVHTIVFAVENVVLVASVAAARAARTRAKVFARRAEAMHTASATLARSPRLPEATEVLVASAIAVLGADGIGAWLVTEDGRFLRKVLSVGREGRDFPGAPGRFEDRRPYERIPIDSEGAIATAARDRTLVTVETPEERHRRFPLIDQTARAYRIPEALACAPMNAHGEVVGVLLFAFEHTRSFDEQERKWMKALGDGCGFVVLRERLLERERHAHQQAGGAARAKSEFLASLSGELAAPVTAIVAWARSLRRFKRSDRTRSCHGFEMIERSARAEAAMISDLVEMASVPTLRLKGDVVQFDLAKLVGGAVDEQEEEASRRGVALERGPVPNATVLVDPARIGQALEHVLAVAVRSAGSGGRVRCGLEIGAHEASVQIEAFGSTRNGVARNHDGLSNTLDFELSFAKYIVEEHRGRVRAEEDPPARRTIMRIELPLALASAAAGPSGAREGSPLVRGGARLRTLRVLVVEQDPDTSYALNATLASEGAVVRSAPSSDTAMGALQRFAPHVIVCDTALPEGSADSFVKAVRAHGAAVPAIALIDRHRPDRIRTAQAAGFERQLEKPPNSEALIRMVAELARQRRSPPDPRSSGGLSATRSSAPR
jgi:signal transduction histidine kinase/CheY-like chemotaxis protein